MYISRGELGALIQYIKNQLHHCYSLHWCCMQAAHKTKLPLLPLADPVAECLHEWSAECKVYGPRCTLHTEITHASVVSECKVDSYVQ